MIISIANQKGGVGKTTIATNLICNFVDNGSKALLIDADVQKSAMDFRNVRLENESIKQFPAVSNTTRSIKDDVKAFTDFDYVVIDVGGRDSIVFRSALAGSDIVIVPVCPSPYDFWGSEQTFSIIAEAKEFNISMKAFAVINMARANTIIASEVSELIEDFQHRFPIKFLKNVLYDRIVYKYSANQGRAVFEMIGKELDQKANDEFKAFFKELKSECQGY